MQDMQPALEEWRKDREIQLNNFVGPTLCGEKTANFHRLSVELY